LVQLLSSRREGLQRQGPGFAHATGQLIPQICAPIQILRDRCRDQRLGNGKTSSAPSARWCETELQTFAGDPRMEYVDQVPAMVLRSRVAAACRFRSRTREAATA